MKGIYGGYELSELLFGRGGSADAIVNVAAVEFRFWAVVLAKKLMFDKTYKKIDIFQKKYLVTRQSCSRHKIRT